MIQTRNIDLIRDDFFLDIWMWPQWINSTNIVGVGTGPTELTEVSSFGTTGADLATNDTVTGRMKIPRWWDPNYELGMRLLYTSTATSGTHTHTFNVSFIASGAALADASGTLNTAIANLAVPSVASALNWSSRGIKNAGWLTQQQVDTGAFIVWKVTVGGTVPTAGKLLGIEFDFAVNMTRYGRSNQNPPLVHQGSTAYA